LSPPALDLRSHIITVIVMIQVLINARAASPGTLAAKPP
jgi:hypothetical protein